MFTLPHSAPLAELLAAVLATGTVTLCTQCAGPAKHRNRRT